MKEAAEDYDCPESCAQVAINGVPESRSYVDIWEEVFEHALDKATEGDEQFLRSTIEIMSENLERFDVDILSRWPSGKIESVEKALEMDAEVNPEKRKLSLTERFKKDPIELMFFDIADKNSFGRPQYLYEGTPASESLDRYMTVFTETAVKTGHMSKPNYNQLATDFVNALCNRLDAKDGTRTDNGRSEHKPTWDTDESVELYNSLPEYLDVLLAKGGVPDGASLARVQENIRNLRKGEDLSAEPRETRMFQEDFEANQSAVVDALERIEKSIEPKLAEAKQRSWEEFIDSCPQSNNEALYR